MAETPRGSTAGSTSDVVVAASIGALLTASAAGIAYYTLKKTKENK